MVNRGCYDGALIAAGGDNPVLSSCGVGQLNIDNGGNLVLADPRNTGDPTMYDGPAYVFVDDFNVTPDGTITFESFSSAVVDPELSRTLRIWRDVWTDGMDLAKQARRYIDEQITAAAS